MEREEKHKAITEAKDFEMYCSNVFNKIMMMMQKLELPMSSLPHIASMKVIIYDICYDMNEIFMKYV